MPATDTSPSLTAADWTVVLPLKGGRRAKSRLAGPPELATALAQDCLAAVLACPLVRTVLVVTADRATAGWAGAAGAVPVPESGSGPGTGLRPRTRADSALDRAARDGLAVATGVTGILLGDLPALRPEDLSAGLATARGVLSRAAPSAPEPPAQVVVPDAESTGTVLLAALRPERLTPSFGPDSAARHVRAGATRLELALPRLRRDVDTDADLRQAVALGCGPATTAALARLAGWLG
jgi:2-phospho-L-lactate/phosphoenolpyruvate guanylyltransferase